MKSIGRIIRFCVLGICFGMPCYGQINNDAPPFSLSMEQLHTWSENSTLADKKNVSNEPVKERFVAQLSGNLDPKVKVLIAPDGMNNFANYIAEQTTFNLYNFTHWSHIDVLNWFAGTATQTVNIPAKPWVDAAHKNGVKVIGSIFLAVSQYGGSADTVASLLQRDKQGGFPAAQKLIEIATFYGFDGWLMNQETDLTVVKDQNKDIIKGKFDYKRAAFLAKEMQHFMQYLTLIAPPEMEIHWYDAMLLNGKVRWQNELNERNEAFFQIDDDPLGRVSDALFVNYWWDAAMLQSSNQKAKALKRSSYDMYFGADLWPERKAQSMFVESDWLHSIFPNAGNKALSSIALFANNVNFNFSGNQKLAELSRFKTDKQDYRSFYDAETRLFSGDDLNLYSDDGKSSWPGLGRYVPAKSTLTDLPFSTHFNTGHGLDKYRDGSKVSGEWHDLAQQDILPTWQFAVKGHTSAQVFYDFSTAFNGGSSLAIQADLTQGSVEIPLFQSRFSIDADSTLSWAVRSAQTESVLTIWLATSDGQIHQFDAMENQSGWQKVQQNLSHLEGKVVERIGVNLAKSAIDDYSVNIGMLGIH